MTTIFPKRVLAYLLSFLVLLVPALGAAQTYVNPWNVGGVKMNTIPQVLLTLVDAVLLLLAPIAVAFFVYAGFLFVTAQGNESKIAKARNVFFWTFLGAMLILGTKVLTAAIQATIDELK
jgi:hypothetical protein